MKHLQTCSREHSVTSLKSQTINPETFLTGVAFCFSSVRPVSPKFIYNKNIFSMNLFKVPKNACLPVPCFQLFNFPCNADHPGTGQHPPPLPSPVQVQVQQPQPSFLHPLSSCSPTPPTLLFSGWLLLPRTLPTTTLFFPLALPCSLWDLSSPTRDPTPGLGSASTES